MVDLTKLSYEEVVKLSKSCADEIERRRNAKKEELWVNLCKALNAYLTDFGTIEIEFEDEDYGHQALYLHKNEYDATQIGTIEIL